ncbi:hypothetical protein F5878DRAFT_620761 [Lentinula raphanica]|uniref:Uncharacterized protein n=1 Tax=Lentinula raphanica TaxID=153919 RepID=A0AA38P7W4_9AGAR|nr:hypothetical protein F5878DRAFT_620761 [Lentinula raphanica]
MPSSNKCTFYTLKTLLTVLSLSSTRSWMNLRFREMRWTDSMISFSNGRRRRLIRRSRVWIEGRGCYGDGLNRIKGLEMMRVGRIC